MKSSYLENLGNGRFTIHELPLQAQFAPLFGMVTDDLEGDGNLDLLLSGNDYGSEVSVGRYDAFYGLMLRGNGDGTFAPLSVQESGYRIPANAKALVELVGADGRRLAKRHGSPTLASMREEGEDNRALVARLRRDILSYGIPPANA